MYVALVVGGPDAKLRSTGVPIEYRPPVTIFVGMKPKVEVCARSLRDQKYTSRIHQKGSLTELV